MCYEKLLLFFELTILYLKISINLHGKGKFCSQFFKNSYTL